MAKTFPCIDCREIIEQGERHNCAPRRARMEKLFGVPPSLPPDPFAELPTPESDRTQQEREVTKLLRRCELHLAHRGVPHHLGGDVRAIQDYLAGREMMRERLLTDIRAALAALTREEAPCE
jgi:hypothetical protein